MKIFFIIIGIILAIAGIVLKRVINSQDINLSALKEQYDKEVNSNYPNEYSLKDIREDIIEAETNYIGSKGIKRLCIALIIAGIIVVVLSTSIVIIPTGYTGVRTTMGQIDKNTVATGFNMKIPFVQSVKKVNNKQQEYKTDTEIKIWSETKSRTAVYYQGVTVTYTINPNYSAWIYANITNYTDTLITESLIGSALKTASKTLTDEEATNRGVIEKLAVEELQKSLNDKYQKEVVKINKITIANADFDKEYNKAVAAKQEAQLAYEKQAIENKKAIEKATADAEAKKIKAQGEADANIIAAEGEKKANDTLNKSLNDKIIKNKAIEKWNGELPKVTSESGVLVDIAE